MQWANFSSAHCRARSAPLRVARRMDRATGRGRSVLPPEVLRRQLLRRKIVRRNMEVQEVARCMKLRTELFRGRTHIQCARRHNAVEYGLTSLVNFRRVVFSAMAMKYRLAGVVASAFASRPARRSSARSRCPRSQRRRFAPAGAISIRGKRLRSMKDFLFLRTGLKTDRGVGTSGCR